MKNFIERLRSILLPFFRGPKGDPGYIGCCGPMGAPGTSCHEVVRLMVPDGEAHIEQAHNKGFIALTELIRPLHLMRVELLPDESEDPKQLKLTYVHGDNKCTVVFSPHLIQPNGDLEVKVVMNLPSIL